MTVAGDYIGRVRLGVTIGVAGSQSFVWPDGRPAGTYTADAGADGAIGLTVTEVGDDTVTVAWSGAVARRMIGHPWRLLRNGTWLFGDLYVVEAEPTDLDPVEWTVLDGTVDVRVAMVTPSSAGGTGGGGTTVHGDLTGRNEPDQHTTDAITVPAATMPFVAAYYPPASDDLTDHLNTIDDAFVGAASAIVAAHDRANHTGTQAQSTVTNLVADLAAKAPTSHSHAASDVTSGTLDIARLPTGTTSTTVPLGNDARFSDTRTPTDGTVSAAKLDAALAARIPTYVWAATDTAARTTTGSRADDPDLKFTGAANTRYRVDFYVQVSGDATYDAVLGVNAPTGATCSLLVEAFGGAVSAATGANQQGAHITTPTPAGVVSVGVLASPGLAYRISGWVQLDATAGDVALYWGPNSNGGTGVIRHANSHLIHTP